MWIHATHDSSLWPPRGLSYKRAVDQAQGPTGAEENFRIRWTENAEHTPPMMMPAQPNRSAANWRSEEHTSELPSLMRTSYADFCLKKKKTIRSTERYIKR